MTEPIQYTTRASSAASLVVEVEAAVASGRLAPGQRLPSVRRLATDGGLSPATVQAGLAELRRRGVVVSESRRGSRIGERPPLARAGGLSVARLPDGVCDLSTGNPDPALLPDVSSVLGGLATAATLYGEAPELPELAEPARAAMRADGVPAAELCVVSGALDGIERALAAWLRPGDRVAVESPGYAPLFDLLRAQGLALEPVAIDERGMQPAGLSGALERGARAVVVTPRGQNPTGAAFDAERAVALRGLLAEHPEVLLLEDDHLGAVAGSALHTLAGAGARWAAARSVSKALGPDLRLAVLAGDEATVARVRGRQLCGPGWVSHVLQRIVAALWADEAVSALVASAERRYAKRRLRLLTALDERGLSAEGRSGLNVWMPVPDEAATAAALLGRGWAVAGGARYKLHGRAGAIRITTASLRGSDTQRLAADLAAVLAPVTATRKG
ncbi:MAG TPA: aminotransferase class I/II-fold pyridoxal phosphate-dependent enzyme [Solirubrobacteraceae bacterium]|nr:aminotransferase class I/II-fold pyridoxal phosphate-dependent enzyme [Solirubrobacteraceae bacterium]